MNKNRKKAVVSTLAAGMAAVLGTGSVFGAMLSDESTVSKEETVYINANADGSVRDITVSDWLKNSGDTDSELKDSSDLENIKNVKGNETFTQDSNEITWNTEGEDIYYQGTTDKELPVTMNIRYYLDGKEISPGELAGKSGHLKMVVSYTNHAKNVKKINGKNTDIYSPFVMVTGMLLPTEHFKDVNIDNGKVISDGRKNMAVGLAMPGLSESLQLSDGMEKEIEIPEGFTVEAEVTDLCIRELLIVLYV